VEKEAEQALDISQIDPRVLQVEEFVDKLQKKVLMWEVVGGAREGGVVVREGASLQSPEMRQRLATGSIVREIAEKGDRLCYQLLSGFGPPAGWVSIKVRRTEMLASVSKRPELAERANLLLRRLARLPRPLQNATSFQVKLSNAITEQIYSPKTGCLDRLAKEATAAWLNAAMLRRPLDVSAVYPAFPTDDAVLRAILEDPDFVPLRRVFPKPLLSSEPSAGGEPGEEGDLPPVGMCPSIAIWRARSPAVDPASGLIPDAISTAFFLDMEHCCLRGAVRFGPQASQSMMTRTLPAECGPSGEFAPGVHGGAISILLADSAVYLARLTWQPNAMLAKLSCQFSKPCPCLQTLEVTATWGLEDNWAHHSTGMTAKVYLKAGKTTIASAEAYLMSFPEKPFKLPVHLPSRFSVARPGVDWVPPELAVAKLPPPVQKMPAYSEQEYMKAVFDRDQAVLDPRSCAVVEEVGTEERNANQGWRKHLRANRPIRGIGEIHHDLCFPGGLAPAAMSSEKYLVQDTAGIRFVGAIKLGPQASEAIYLTEDGKKLADGTLSLVAHPAMGMAALDDHLAHLPRCDGREKTSVTWKQEMEVKALLPVGQELEFECFCPEKQGGPVGTSVQGEIRYEDQVLVTLSAIITSSDRDAPGSAGL